MTKMAEENNELKPTLEIVQDSNSVHTGPNAVCLAEKAVHVAMVKPKLPPFLWVLLAISLLVMVCAILVGGNIRAPAYMALALFFGPIAELLFIFYTRFKMSLAKGLISPIQIFQKEETYYSKHGPFQVVSTFCRIETLNSTVQLGRFHPTSVTQGPKLLSSMTTDAVVYASNDGQKVFAIVLGQEVLLVRSPLERLVDWVCLNKMPWDPS